MDQPDLDPALHDQALRALERVNRISRSTSMLWGPIEELARRTPGRPVRVLDLATGAGDIPVALWQRARRAGITLEIEACDRSDHALAHARERAERCGAKIRFFPWDALRGPLPNSYDIVVCSLFLHHLDTPDAVAVLRHMANSARRLVLVNDLRRSISGWLLAWLVARVLTRSPVVHIDAPLSVAAAFTCAEAADLARQAGMAGATVRRRWPWRWLLTWHRPSSESNANVGKS